MLKKDVNFKKSLNFLLFIIVGFVLVFSIFAFFIIKTNINILENKITTLNETLSESLNETNKIMLGSLSKIDTYSLTGMGILAVGALFLFFMSIYVIKDYYSAMENSLVDELTGLYNRRALYKILDQELKRAERFKHPLTIAMLDLDFFKVFNDKNGHVAGDRLLQKLSKILTGKVRDVDSVARFGGEEFIIILPETPHDSAAKIAERIRKTVEGTYFKGQETQPKKKITLSMGLVTYHGEYKGRTQLIHSADELLYQAKRKGRNQMISAYHKDKK